VVLTEAGGHQGCVKAVSRSIVKTDQLFHPRDLDMSLMSLMSLKAGHLK